jgi:hypothetical protein
MTTPAKPTPLSMPGPHSVNGKRPKAPQKKPAVRPVVLDDAQELAKQTVIRNYNDYRNPGKRPLTTDLVYIFSFSRWGDSWLAAVRSRIVRNFNWIVSRDDATGEITIEVFQRVNTTVYPPEYDSGIDFTAVVKMQVDDPDIDKMREISECIGVAVAHPEHPAIVKTITISQDKAQ